MILNSAADTAGVPSMRFEPPLHRAALMLTWALPLLLVAGRGVADTALSLCAVLFLARSAYAGEWTWLRTGWVRIALALWVYLMASSIWAENPGQALYRAGPWIRFPLFAAALQHWVLTTTAARRTLVRTTGTALALVVVFGFVDLLLDFRPFVPEPKRLDRLYGPFRDMVVGAFLMKLCFPVLGGMMDWAGAGRNRTRIGVTVAAALAIGIAILFSGERGALLLFGAGLLCLLLAPGLRRAMILAAAVFAILGAGLITTNDTLRDRVIGDTAKDLGAFWSSPYGAIFATSVAVWWDHPVTGVGLKNFREVCSDNAYKRFGPRRCAIHPHNPYLEWAAEAGTIGLAGFLALIVAWGRRCLPGLRKPDPERLQRIGTVIGCMTFFWPVISSMSVFSNWHAALLWLSVGWALAVAPQPVARLRDS